MVRRGVSVKSPQLELMPYYRPISAGSNSPARQVCDSGARKCIVTVGPRRRTSVESIACR